MQFFLSERSQLDLHRDDRERGIGREKTPVSSISKAGASVQSDRGGVVAGRPESQAPQPPLATPADHFLEQRAPDSAPAPGGLDPHATDPACVATRPVQQAVRRAEDVVTFTRQK